MSVAKIPFLDMVGLHAELKEDFIDALRKAIETGHFVGGTEVETFEREFAVFTGSKYCIGVNSGTDALRFAFIAGGIEPGSIVITAPNTFIATVEAISQAGARVAFVDVDPGTLNMSPAALKRFLENECRYVAASKKTIHLKTGLIVGGVVPVHLYGQPVAMDELSAIASTFNLPIYEDACQAHGSDYLSRKSGSWLRAGSMGRAAGFSFYPGKNLGALGEAGAVTTDDPEIAAKVRLLREHGSTIKYYHEIEGYNGRIDAIQASFLRSKLRRLGAWNQARRAAASYYNQAFSSVPEVTPLVQPEWTRSNFHLYIIRSPERDALKAHLEAEGIGTGLHYPLPLHLQKAYKRLGYAPGRFPVTELAANEILSLPMFPGLTRSDQDRVVEAVKQFLAKEAFAGMPEATTPEPAPAGMP